MPWWPGLIFLALIISAGVIKSPHPFYAGIIAYIIANRILQKKSNITVHLCYAHSKRRLISYIVQAISAFLAPELLASGILVYSQLKDGTFASIFIFVGGAFLIALAIAHRITSRLVILESVRDGLFSSVELGTIS